MPGDSIFVGKNHETILFKRKKEALETVACLETAPLPVEYGPPRAQSAVP